MKKLLLPILLACALALPVRGQSILVIDVNGVFNNLTEVQTEIAKIKNAVEEYNGYLSDQAKVLTDLQNRVQNLAKEADNMNNTPASRDTFKQQAQEQAAIFEGKRRDIANFQQMSNNLVQQAQESLVKTQLDRIRDEVKAVAMKKKATLVVNKANMGMISAIIFNDDALDISNEVRDSLNKAPTATTLPALPVVPTETKATATPAKATGTAK